jgi:hypothetical protein
MLRCDVEVDTVRVAGAYSDASAFVGAKRIDGEDLAWQLRCLAHSGLLDCGLDAVQ